MLGRVPQLCFDLFARQYALELISVLKRIDERLNEEKQKLSALDFDDLELRALELLDRPEVMARAAERYKFFLVDEFQDTNSLQRELLERLALQKSRRDRRTCSSSAIANNRSMDFAAQTWMCFAR